MYESIVSIRTQLRALLDSRLPLVWAGKPVSEAMLPWPKAHDIPEDTVIPTLD